VMAEALRTVFADMAPPAPPEGFVVLGEPGGLKAELENTGLSVVDVCEIEIVWDDPDGEAYLADVKEMHRYMGAYPCSTTIDVDGWTAQFWRPSSKSRRVTRSFSALNRFWPPARNDSGLRRCRFHAPDGHFPQQACLPKSFSLSVPERSLMSFGPNLMHDRD
jgi:hypothetical protein